jgi:2-polyprenyl-3-methyl-5-hydroxy-6-metoxy-1,4-benzoquinol methylase
VAGWVLGLLESQLCLPPDDHEDRRGVNGDVLDVGCGEGLLVERLARVSRGILGIDPDSAAISQAELRTSKLPNGTVTAGDFTTMEIPPESYDLVTFVAVIHHMDLQSALRKSSQLLRPGGQLLVVGVAANKSAVDFIRSALLLPIIRFMGVVHHETRNIQVTAIAPKEGFAEVRKIAHRELPGSQLRRALYYRYVLRWSKPL